MPQPTTTTIYGKLFAPDEPWLARALPEEALEPELPIVDAHVHFWDSPYPGAGSYFATDFARDTVECGHTIEAAVYVECHSMYRARGPEHLRPVGETEFAVGMAAMGASEKYTPTRLAAAIIGATDLTQHEQAREALQAHIAAGNGRFRGIRQRAKWDPDPVVRGSVHADGPGLYLREDFGRGLDLLTSLGLVFEASVYHPQIPDITALARAHPDATIIVNHSGSPVGHASYAGKEGLNLAQWTTAMRELATCPNVSVKLGGVLMHLGNYDFTAAPRPVTSQELADLWRPYMEGCIELFGPERCMVSSNFPVDKAGFGYRTVWNMFKRIAAGLPVERKAALFSGTALRVYGIG